MKRAAQALQLAGPRGLEKPTAFDDARRSKLLADVQAAIAAPPPVVLADAKPRLVAAAPPAPAARRAERVELPMMCAARNVSYVTPAERRGDAASGCELRLLRQAMPQIRSSSDVDSSDRLSGQYRIDTSDWACPFCNSDEVWVCDCDHMRGAMHCHGADRKRYHCACGKWERRKFTEAETVEVCGSSVAATPAAGRSGSSRG
jgi:hypothetical protein